MYESFYGFRERPFSLLPDPAFLFLSKRHGMALTMLEYGLMNHAGIMLITGEIGSGKTTIVRHLLNQLGEDTAVGLINNTHHAFGELMEWVCMAYELPYEGLSKVQRFHSFQNFLISQYAKGRRTILIVDEAQNMDAATLEELRVLSNINADKDQVLQLILVGQPELRRTLRRPDLEQFVQRIGVDYHLGRFNPEETDAYISHRIRVAGGDAEIFDRFARRFIHHQSAGVPRIINTLCDMALVYGFAEQKPRIEIELVHAVVQDRIKNGLFGAGKRPGTSSIDLVDPADEQRLAASLADIRAEKEDGEIFHELAQAQNKPH